MVDKQLRLCFDGNRFAAQQRLTQMLGPGHRWPSLPRHVFSISARVFKSHLFLQQKPSLLDRLVSAVGSRVQRVCTFMWLLGLFLILASEHCREPHPKDSERQIEHGKGRNYEPQGCSHINHTGL